MPCYGVLGGCAPTTPFFNIKKIALFMYSGNFPNGSCPPDCSGCDDVWVADVCGFAYDPDERHLTLYYHSGAAHVYKDVPAEKVASLRESASTGRYFSERIRGNYPSRKLG